jgi:hypothetical protein
MDDTMLPKMLCKSDLVFRSYTSVLCALSANKNNIKTWAALNFADLLYEKKK